MIPKFRAWHKPTQLMDDVVLIDFYDEKIGILYADPFVQGESIQKYNFKEIELMQSTGLHDKNGVEIFEGDIVRIDFNKAENTNIEHAPIYGQYAYEDGVINWYQEYASFMYDGFHNFGTNYEIFCEEMTDLYEVIGNIYENKDLLGVQNERNKL